MRSSAPPHVCTEHCIVLNRDSRYVCRVTGQCYHQYINTNPFYTDKEPQMPAFAVPKATASPKPKPRRRAASSKAGGARPRPNLTAESIQQQIHRLLNLLLFSSKRSSVEEDKKSSRQDKIRSVSSRHHRKRRKLERAQVSDDRRRAIEADVHRIVSFCHAHRPFLKIEPLILGALYLMQHGKTMRSLTIPKHDVLYLYLPSISDLPLFNLRKNIVRIGSNTIIRCARELG